MSTLPRRWRDPEDRETRPCDRCPADGARPLAYAGRRYWLCEECWAEIRRR